MIVYLCRRIPGQMAMSFQSTGSFAADTYRGSSPLTGSGFLPVAPDTIPADRNDRLIPQDTAHAQPSSMEETMHLTEADSIGEQQADSFHQKDSQILLPPKSLEISERQSGQADWIFGILILTVALFAWVRLFFNRYLASLFPGLVLYPHSNKLYRESNLLYERFSFLMNLLFVLTGGLFFSLVKDHFFPGLPLPGGFTGFVLFSAGLSVIFIIRSALCRLVGFFSLSDDLFREYVHGILLINKALGIVLLPVVIGIPYLPEVFAPGLFYGGLGLFILAYLFRVYKALQINLAKGFSLLWMILYLCALEILPYLLIFAYWDSHITQVV